MLGPMLVATAALVTASSTPEPTLLNCDCAIIDVGLNNGATLLQWPAEAVARLQGNTKKGDKAIARSMHRCLAHKDTACFYGFEANPVFDGRLRHMETQLRREGRKVQLFASTAFGTSSQNVTFFVQPAGPEGSTGSSLDGSKPLTSVIRRTTSKPVWYTNLSTEIREHYVETTVQSVDAAAFLARMHAASAFVAVKIDIEGYEYTLLKQLLLTAPSVVCRLKLLVIEWHERKMPAHAGEAAHLIWLMKQAECGVQLLAWHRR
jgi:hypothetical protein